jgi:hypothetical protein
MAEVIRVLHAERPNLGPAQARAVPAERLGDRPDVRPGAHEEVEGCGIPVELDQTELPHRRAAHRHLHHDATPVELVRPFACDLDR